MKNLVMFIGTLFLSVSLVSQESDIVTPETSPFDPGTSIEGMVQSSVNEATGKVTFSVPLTSIASRSVSYPVNLLYNGATAFDTGQQLHKYSPVSTVGVGFSLNVPKIVADNKGTAARDDDTFYLIDGTNNTKLVCTKKVQPTFPSTGNSYQDFAAKKYVPYKIRYNINNIDIVNGIYVTTVYDYWEITDDKGVTHIYGNTANTRENVLAWGNWIGDSKNTSGASQHTTVWNLSKIEDQWGNNLTFSYNKIEQGINTTGPKHTEASYIQQITSSSGGKVVLNYSNKTVFDYYEPHKEVTEPDAYQEKYERKLLESVSTYDQADQLINTYDFAYDYINTVVGERKMYLIGLTLNNGSGNTLPPQEFEYYTTGNFTGGIKKVTYPSGGSVTYNYENKLLFNNTANRYSGTVPGSSGYTFHGNYVRDNYVLRLYRSVNPISGGKYRFKMIRHWWNGENWLSHEFVFPYLLSDENLVGKVMDRFLAVFEEDFYGFLYFDRDTEEGQLYLFHLEENGLTWKYDNFIDIPVESWNDSNKQEDPVFMSGEGFAMIGTNRTGRLHTYVWNGSGWNNKQIQQGAGQYYYATANNFVLALDEDGGATDMVTGATNHPDNYYFHYLDAEKKWHTKSWSAAIHNNFTYVAGTNEPSLFYAYNNMIGFVADNNPEYFLRWDTDYNLIGVDDVLGTYPDTYPMYPSMGSMFTIQNSWFNSFPEKTARFNGSSWNYYLLNPDNFNSYSSTAFGEDFILMYDRIQNNRYKMSYVFYNPNTNTWDSGLYPDTFPFGAEYNLSVSYNRDFIVAGNKIAKFNNTASKLDPAGSLPGENYLTYSNTLNYTFVGLHNGGTYDKGMFYYVDKATGNITGIDVGYKTYATGHGATKFGGHNHFLSFKSMFLRSFGAGFTPYIYRIIDDGVLNNVYDIVVSDIQIDNNSGEIRTVDYAYNNPNTLPDGESAFYGQVIIQNKGTGSGNVGKTKKYFNTGEEDVQMAGLQDSVIIEDKNGLVIRKTETTWKKFIKVYQNSSFTFLDVGYYVRPEKQIERLYLDGQEVITETNNSYNTLGLLVGSSKINSNGETENTSIQYAYQVYSFVNNENMLTFPHKTQTFVGGESVGIEQSIWKYDGKVYAYQNKSGTGPTVLRMNNEITKVDDYGNIQESHNGLGTYKTVLYGYGNLYPVATITNAGFTDVVNELDVSYTNLQSLSNSSLETELRKLYGRLPGAMININIYDNQGQVITSFDEREESVNFLYDSFGRLEYTTDANDKVIKQNAYNFGSQ